MQAFPITQPRGPYYREMQTGRPSKRPRSNFGQRLHVAREALGLSQAQVAEKLGITQSSYADWERYTVAIRPEQLTQLASILQVPVGDLLGASEPKSKRPSSAKGRMKQMFEAASHLPRRQQQKIVDLLQPFVREHVGDQGKAA
jgi:transcriptional regulator with XRE-family HTH domain